MITHAFLNHPLIRRIAGYPKWTFSNSNKAPIDFKEYRNKSRVRGSCYHDERCLETLYGVIDFMETMRNAAFYLSAEDQLICLDIEPKCPPEIRDELLKIPALYAETSLSGKGYHLWFDAEDLFELFPSSKSAMALKGENGDYEFLVNHWCTFTGNTIQQETDPQSDPYEMLKARFGELAEKRKESEIHRYSQTFTEPVLPHKNELIQRILDHQPQLGTQLQKSEFEFSWLQSATYSVMYYLKHLPAFLRPTLDENQIAWIIYLAALDPRSEIHGRDKHTEKRNGIPMLLYSAHRAVERNEKLHLFLHPDPAA